MFDEKKALNYILEIAFKKGFTQTDLAKDIYDYSHFNRMCNGKEHIHKEVLYECAKKLGLSIEELNRYGSDSQFDIKENNDVFERLLQEKKYGDILVLYEKLIKFDNEDQIITIRQFIMRVHACVELRCRCNLEQAIKILYNALALTQKNIIDREMYSFVVLTGNEWSILNDIALCEYESGNVDKAIIILKKALDKNVDSSNKEITRNNIKTLYYLSLYLMRMKKITESLKYTKWGIYECVNTITYSFLFPLYYNFAILYYLQMNEEKFNEFINISYILALTQNKTFVFLKTLKEDIILYNIPDEIYNKYKDMADALITERFPSFII